MGTLSSSLGSNRSQVFVPIGPFSRPQEESKEMNNERLYLKARDLGMQTGCLAGHWSQGLVL